MSFIPCRERTRTSARRGQRALEELITALSTIHQQLDGLSGDEPADLSRQQELSELVRRADSSHANIFQLLYFALNDQNAERSLHDVERQFPELVGAGTRTSAEDLQ